jgi:hypothetical protein
MLATQFESSFAIMVEFNVVERNRRMAAATLCTQRPIMKIVMTCLTAGIDGFVPLVRVTRSTLHTLVLSNERKA